MNLPWDKKYLKISFHIIFTVIIIYLSIIFIDNIVLIIKDIKNIILSILYFIKGIIRLFSILIVALVISYLLDPVVDFFQHKYDILIKSKLKYKLFNKDKYNIIKNVILSKKEENNIIFKKRTAGVVLAYIVSLLFISVSLYFLVKSIGGNILDKDKSIIDNIINIINNMVEESKKFIEKIELKLETLSLTNQFTDIIDNIVKETEKILYKCANSIVKFLTTLGSNIIHFIISLVIAFYIMRDKFYIKHIVKDIMNTFLPNKINKIVKDTLSDLHFVFSGYIRGQLIDAFILTIMILIGLKLIHVEYAIFIAFITGISSLIPFIGGIVAFVLAVACELLLGSYITAIKAAIAIIVIHEMEIIFIVPRILGTRVHLSPPLVLLSLPIGGSLFGIMGMLFAVPVCAIVKIFLTRFIERYKEKKEIDLYEQLEKKQNNFKMFIKNINKINE